jgi:superfamily II DNA or RNA helicase
MIKLEAADEGCVAICVTNATLQSQDFQRQIRLAKTPVFFIGDEVHNLGAEGANSALPANASLRLGLSATPVRAGDEEGTAKIVEYFGKTVAEFTLDDAISHGFLTPYEYHPVFVKLTDYEATEYVKLTKKYARLASSSRPEHRVQAEMTLYERARVLGAAYNKLGVLVSLLVMNGLRKGLVYCSDGTMSGLDGQPIGPQIDQVVKALRERPLGFKVNRFMHHESPEVRKRMINEIAVGTLDGLVAIKCLDEGVDVPSLEVAYILASSKNPRQSIQRRGRLLRKSPGKERSIIYDFVIEPPSFSSDIESEVLAWEKKLFEAELSRGMEFARLAINKAEAEEKFNLVRTRCGF